jgi:hypothetical protein
MERTTEIFDHAAHFEAVARRDQLRGWIPGNQACRVCHAPELPKGAPSARPCLDCHEKDMSPSRGIDSPLELARATGYRVALHENCVTCHEKEAARQRRPALAECGTCHESLRPRGLRTALPHDLVAAILR